MAKRSLQASREGARLARKAFDLKGWTQENLAAELELKTRQPIWRFFTCRPVERHIFTELCHILDLNWWEIAEHPPEFLLGAEKEQRETLSLSTPPQPADNVNSLVEQVRTSCRDWIENQCGVLRVLDTSSPAQFDALYVPIDVVRSADHPQCLGKPQPSPSTAAPLKTEDSLPQLPGSAVKKVRIPGLQAVQQHAKLRVLGKPGSGKTAFLKHLALRCIRGESGADKVPLLIYLDSFVTYCKESGKCSLYQFICDELSGRGIRDAQTVAALLAEGRFVLLFDAIDEIAEPDSYAVYKEITRFTERYYSNQVVMTARLASDRFEFSHFTDVEIADFTDEQVVTLSKQWFKVFAKAGEQASPAQFLQQLRQPENQSIATLARLPLLFNSIAQLFQKQGELAAHHLEIYANCLSILFERWDRTRGISRNWFRSDLSISVKEAVLVQLGAIGIQQRRAWFKKQEILQWTEAHLQQLYAGTPTSAQAVSKKLLEALEHHGLLVEYSQGCFAFAFPGFQSYFTARWLAASEHPDVAAALTRLIAEPQWRETVLLACELATETETVVGITKQAIEQLAAKHPDLAGWMSQMQQLHLKLLGYREQYSTRGLRSLITRTPATLAQSAKLLFELHALESHLQLEVLFGRLLKGDLLLASEGFLGLEKMVTLLDQVSALLHRSGYSSVALELLQLKRQLPNLDQTSTQLQSWWQTHSAAWVDQLRQVLAGWDDGHHQLASSDRQALESYAYLSQLLSDCLSARSRRHSAGSIVPRAPHIYLASGGQRTPLKLSLDMPRGLMNRPHLDRIEDIEIGAS